MKGLKYFCFFIAFLGMACLGFSFVEINPFCKQIAEATYDTEIVENIVNGNCVEKAGAIYLSAGSTYNMSGGSIFGHYAEKGGAIYISDGAVFTMTGGEISGNYAKYGGAIYVASGGECYINGGTITGNFAENAPAIYVENGGILKVSSSAVVENNNIINMTAVQINIHVDGTLAKTINKIGDTYTIDEAEMPLDYESCCGYFYDEKLTQCTNGEVVLTANEGLSFASKTATSESNAINIYTKTASDASNFSFSFIQSSQVYEIEASSTNISGDIVFPKEYNDYKTQIFDNALNMAEGAFSSCINITSITFPDGLESVARYAFYNCSGIVSQLVLPDSIKVIDDGAFYGCTSITGNLVLHEGITYIGENAFSSCSSITGNLNLPKSLISIESYSFSGCSGLSGDLIIPEGVETINDFAFYNSIGF
ncbi:MAG: leucine-rich repeat domain-containing protein, partial [Clostridia bacterium]|nr:leucine-rich repeat domain-containing protein [Clostridia bacterium]